MKFRVFPALILAVTLSVVTSKIVYFGFNSSYTRAIFDRKMFDEVFSRDVYKYRLLSKYLLVGLDNQLKKYIPKKETHSWVFPHTKGESEHLYYSFFYLNTFFLVLASIIWSLLLGTNGVFILTDTEKYLFLFLVPIIINLSQFVVTPYDTSSYFLHLLILYLFLARVPRNYILRLFTLCILLITSTLNRESSALTLTILGLLLFHQEGISKQTIQRVFFLFASFICTYILLRIFVTNPLDAHLINTMAGDFTNTLNITGLVCWGLFLMLTLTISLKKENKYMIFFYHLFNLPYILVCLANGVLWEVRLYIPLFLGSVLLSRIDVAHHTIQISRDLPAFIQQWRRVGL